MAAAEKPKTLKEIWSETKPDFYRDVYSNQMGPLLVHLNKMRAQQVAARREEARESGANVDTGDGVAVSITLTAGEVLALLGLRPEQWDVAVDVLHGVSECVPEKLPDEIHEVRCFHPLSLVSAPIEFSSGDDPVQFMGAALDPAAAAGGDDSKSR